MGEMCGMVVWSRGEWRCVSGASVVTRQESRGGGRLHRC